MHKEHIYYTSRDVCEQIPKSYSTYDELVENKETSNLDSESNENDL